MFSEAGGEESHLELRGAVAGSAPLSPAALCHTPALARGKDGGMPWGHVRLKYPMVGHCRIKVCLLRCSACGAVPIHFEKGNPPELGTTPLDVSKRQESRVGRGTAHQSSHFVLGVSSFLIHC